MNLYLAFYVLINQLNLALLEGGLTLLGHE